MWGICFDISVSELFQHIVEYDYENNVILKPMQNIKVPANKIKFVDNVPEFIYNEIVSPVNHTNVKGKIYAIVWHSKRKEFCYYIKVNGKKKSKRYYKKDLIKNI